MSFFCRFVSVLMSLFWVTCTCTSQSQTETKKDSPPQIAEQKRNWSEVCRRSPQHK
jgi:hypothetical protein